MLVENMNLKGADPDMTDGKGTTAVRRVALFNTISGDRRGCVEPLIYRGPY